MIRIFTQYAKRSLRPSDKYRHAALLAVLIYAGFAVTNCGAAEPPSSASQDSSVAITKSEILASPRWKRAQKALNDWLSVQNIYNADEVVQLKKSWASEVDEMDAEQLQDCLDDMEQKLTILLSPQVEQARAWVGSYMAVLADPYREELRRKLPDVANMTVAQIQQSLKDVQLAQQKHAGRGTRETNRRQAAVDLSKSQNAQSPTVRKPQNQIKAERANARAKQSANNAAQNARERARTTPEWYRQRRGLFGWFR